MIDLQINQINPILKWDRAIVVIMQSSKERSWQQHMRSKSKEPYNY